ncbi:MAG TPA: nucleotidyltransferase [Actinomycetota bacterium]|nr:nucleotidyltransferase [Actinomycetota bacterium]
MAQAKTVPSYDVWQGTVQVDDEVFFRVLGQTVEIMQRSGIPHLFMGGLASAALGRPRWTHDIDMFVKRDDARRTLSVLHDEGFLIQETDPQWLFKALKEDVLVDVIFRSSGMIFLDDEMVDRAQWVDIEGHRVPVVSPEDLVVIKALVHKERAPRHWFDALALLRREELDWEYLVRRALQFDPTRVLSLLIYARSADQAVPAEPVDALSRATGLEEPS